MLANDFSVWINGAPYLASGGNWDFSVWWNGAPMIRQDEGGPITTLSGGGYGFAVGSGFVSRYQGVRGVGYGFVLGTGSLINRIGLIAGTGYGFVVGTGDLGNRTGLMAGSGYGFVIGTGLLTSGVPVVVILHRRLSPVQPRLRHLDYVGDKWWVRKVSPKSERVRILS